MQEDLGKLIERLMVEQWYLPEALVQAFMSEHFSEASSIEQLRDAATNMLQDMILTSGEPSQAYVKK